MKKTALITGGTRGIGRAISENLAAAGYHVFALYARNRKAAESLEEKAKAEGWSMTVLRGDLTKPETLSEIESEIKATTDTLNVIVHNAASGVHRAAEGLKSKHMRWTMEINVMSAHELLTKFLEMIPKGGRVVGLTSAGGTQVIPYYAAVGASKGALESLFRHYAVEWAPKGISVNLVCPGMVATDAIEAFPDKDQRVESCAIQTPSGRMTTPEDVAELVHFLATSQVAEQIVGQTLVVDGGKCIKS